jgi:endogenous inhibitor of DNA gyrase (YacG/DUF329 family)
MENRQLAMRLPLDPDGFLRRECPTCERELKWRAATEEGAATPPPAGGYFCPYCAVQGPVDAWFTKPQLEAARAHAYSEVFKPELEKTFAGPGYRLDLKEGLPASPLTESNDMRRVDFECHPEPVKVLDDWDRPVHCPICGTSAESRARSG